MTTKGYRHTEKTKRKICIFTKKQELQICKQYIEDKLSTCIIAKRRGCDPSTICNIIKRHGYTLRTPSDSHLGQKAWNKNIPCSETTKEKIRNKLKENKNALGKHWKLSEKTKRKMRKNRKGKNNPNFGKIGKNHPFYGKHHSEKTKQEMRDKKLGKKRKSFSEKTKQKMREKAILRHRTHSGPYKDTKPELKMEEILIFLHIPYEKQFRVGNHVVDFHLLNTNRLIEVDGDYWHGNLRMFQKLNKIQKESKQRDKRVNKLAKENNYILLRFWESNILNNTEEVKIELLNWIKK